MPGVQQPTILFLERWNSAEGPKDFSIQSYRATITDLVGNFLTDLDDVAETLTTSGSGQASLGSLNMCLEFLGENTEIFLQVVSQGAGLADSQVPLEEKSSQAFCMWFMKHLMRLLCRPDCSKLHDIIIRLVVQILQDVKLRSKFVFKIFILEFINTALALIEGSNLLYGNAEEVEVVRFGCDIKLVQQSLKDPATPQNEQVLNENKLEGVCILLSDPEHCELLQVNITKTLLKMFLDVCKFCSTHLETLWECLCTQVQDGDLDLKLVSLEGLCQLLDIEGPPPLQVRELFLSCVSGLWELLCTHHNPLDQSEQVQLEIAASKLINSLIRLKAHPSFSFKQYFYRDFLNRIVEQGLDNVRCREGKEAMGSMIVCLLSSLPKKDMNLQINKSVLDNLTFHLLGIVGAEQQFELVTPVMVHLTLLEAQQYSDSYLSSSKLPDTTPTHTPAITRKRRHPSTALTSKMKLPTFDLLVDKLSEIPASRPPTKEEMNCVNIVIRVAVQCSLKLIEMKSRLPLLNDSLVEHALACWKGFVMNVDVNPGKKEQFLDTYHCLVALIGCISCVSDTYPTVANVSHEFTWMVSLPWLLNDLSWKDLKPRAPKVASEVASRLASLIGGEETKSICLKALTVLPKETAPQWRSHVYTLAMSDDSPLTRRTLMKHFPVALQNTGVSSTTHLISLLTPFVGEESDFAMELAQVFGGIALVQAQIGALDRSCIMGRDWLDFGPTIVVNNSVDLTTVKDSNKPEDFEWVSPFLRFLEHSKLEIRRAASHSLCDVLLCIKVGTSSSLVKDLITCSLNILEDEDFNLRSDFSSIVTRLVTRNANNPLKKPVASDYTILEFLKSLCMKAHHQNNVKLHETALMAVGQLGRVVDGKLLEECVICLLENRLNKHLLDAIAFEELEEISAYKGEPLQQIYVCFKRPICKFLAEAMYTDQQSNDGVNAKNIVINIANTLGFDDVKTFIQGNEKYLLPFLVSKATPEATKLIKLLANLQFPNNIRRTLLINNTKYIFSYLVCFCQKQEMEKSLLYLQSETDFSLGNLLRLDFQRVHNELLLHLSTHYHQVFSGLKTLASNDEQYKGPKDISSTEQMATYLEPRLLGVLAFFDSQLMNSNITLQDKELSLKSVVSIIRLMGSKHISSIRHKVMNTLRLSLQFKESSFVEISCKAWNCFVRSLELPLLGTMMSQIIATLLPLLQCLPRDVADIINYIILDNRKSLSKHFHEIYFLPDIPELKEAIAILKQHGDSTDSDPDLKTSLTFSIKGINHESLDVKMHALSKLSKILKERKTDLYDYILNDESTGSVISELISALLNGCRDVDSKAHVLYGKCLGQLGAVDPGRLELVSSNPVQTKRAFHASIEDNDFAIGLISVMVKTFLAATEPRIQDCSAFALQELLQIYGISESGGSNGGVDPNNQIWKGFPEQTQEILVPLLTSKYRLKVETNWSNYPHPIYGSEKGKQFKDWVSNWTGYLISKVKQTKACQVFSACIATKRHNTQVALSILPHVVLRVLLDGTPKDVAQMLEEILQVLRYMQEQEAHPDSASNIHHVSGQTIFSILDYLTAWRYHRINALATTGNQNLKVAVYEKDMAYQSVNGFLNKIPQEVLAEACYNCKAYARALRHFEVFVNSSGNIQQHLDFMQRLYMSMDEPDGVLGVSSIRQSQPTLMQQILTHQSLGQQQDAQACYERAIQMESEEISHHHGLLRSLIDLAQPNKALIHTAGILADRPRWTSQLNAYRIEAAWKLGSWDKLDEALKLEKHPNTLWPVQVGRILMAYKDKQELDFIEQLDVARKEQMGPLSAATMEIGSYHRGYENILRLHMINEIEEFFQVVVDYPTAPKTRSPTVIGRMSTASLLKQWQSRLQMAQSSFRTQEPILTLRRTLLSLIESERDISLEMQIGKWWLSSAKVARKAGYLQSAYGCLLQASSYHLSEFFLEKAKWLWEKGDNDAAISCLDKGIADNFGNFSQSNKREELDAGQRHVYAESLLLYGKYSEETSHLETNSIVKQYKDVTDICPDWEAGYFHLAKYYDRIMNTIIDDKERGEKQGEFIIYVVKNFGYSLKYGNEHIYQSMPRLLSLWLDYGTMVAEAEKLGKGKLTPKLQIQQTILKRINATINQLSKELAPYQMFTAFPQLISRICHAQPDVFQQLQSLVADLLVQYPQQAMWMTMAVSKSSYPMRVARCQAIFATAISKKNSLAKFIQDGKKLTERLLELCEKDFGSVTTVSLNQMFKPLKRLLEDSNFSQILLPLQSSVTVRLAATPAKMPNHNPFTDNQVYLKGFGDTIEIIVSLQKPKKITMIGSDGNRYVMMCKPKDDLRKDCRLMEFNAIVNKFLRRDAESRRRRLLIRTYTVTPLNEECGLVEWVNNTTGLRHILVGLYKEKGLYMSGRELKSVMPTLQSSVESKLKNFNEKLLPRHPPVFPEWFMRTFPDPTSWYGARVSYARTLAVMSIVGYILGLGDRHGENILFDSTTGDCVHVDFNCLFNKGETFEWPEKVPFRLTHNMIRALGPMGLEGLFRRACEVTLKVIRDQMDPLMSVLKPFIYDPLVEWSKPSKGHRSAESGEINNELALNHVQNIEHRMKGILKTKTKPRCLPLSIEGHVNYLIQEATDEKLLCQMYLGWAAYM